MRLLFNQKNEGGTKTMKNAEFCRIAIGLTHKKLNFMIKNNKAIPG